MTDPLAKASTSESKLRNGPAAGASSKRRRVIPRMKLLRSQAG